MSVIYYRLVAEIIPSYYILHCYLSNSKTFQDGNGNGNDNFWKIN